MSPEIQRDINQKVKTASNAVNTEKKVPTTSEILARTVWIPLKDANYKENPLKASFYAGHPLDNNNPYCA